MSEYQLQVAKRASWTPETPAAKAALQFIIDVDAGITPNDETMRSVRDALMSILDRTKRADSLFGLRQSRRDAEGFTPADIMSSYIELRRRELEPVKGACQRAKEDAIRAFGVSAKDPIREVERMWKAGRHLAEFLDDADLRAILEPHRK